MAATLTQERFTGPEWVLERKFDGIQLVAFRRETMDAYCPAMASREIAPVAEALKRLPVREIILDAEITWDNLLRF